MFINVPTVPCQHIADYYDAEWNKQKNLGNSLLRRGYYQWAMGFIDFPVNNLFEHRFPLAWGVDNGRGFSLHTHRPETIPPERWNEQNGVYALYLDQSE